MILNEVKHYCRNLYTVWLDYQKAFDSVPHSWMIKAYELAKVPTVIIKAIEQLSHQWETILHTNRLSEDIINEIIKYLSGIFQGDCHSVLLLIQSANWLPFLLNKLKRYSLGTGDNRISATHNIFDNDLKLYGSTLDIIKIFRSVRTVRSCYKHSPLTLE